MRILLYSLVGGVFCFDASVSSLAGEGLEVTMKLVDFSVGVVTLETSLGSVILLSVETTGLQALEMLSSFRSSCLSFVDTNGVLPPADDGGGGGIGEVVSVSLEEAEDDNDEAIVDEGACEAVSALTVVPCCGDTKSGGLERRDLTGVTRSTGDLRSISVEFDLLRDRLCPDRGE